jgi:hypothetical protein
LAHDFADSIDRPLAPAEGGPKAVASLVQHVVDCVLVPFRRQVDGPVLARGANFPALLS